MTAKEMFESLGFKRGETNEVILYGKIHDEDFSGDDPFNWVYVTFSKLYKTYDVDFRINGVDSKIHKAIHQQLIEFGWLDDE